MCATWIQVWNILRTCFTAPRSRAPLASVTDWEMGIFPVFVSLVTGFPVFSLGSECAGTFCTLRFMVPLIYLPMLAEAIEIEGEAACHPLPQLS